MAPEDALAAALRWHQAGQTAAARAAYDAILAAFPEQTEVLRLSAVLHLQRGEPAAAAQQLIDTLRLQPQLTGAPEVELKLLLARAFRDGGELASALQTLNETADRYPETAQVHEQLGATHHLAGRLDEATSAYRRAIALEPGAAALKANLAAVLAQAGDAEGSLKHADAALTLDPSLGPAYKVRGTALATLGRPEEGRAALQRAVELAPEPDGWYQLGVVLDELGQWDESLAAQAQALELQPNFGPALSEHLFLQRRLCQWAGADALALRFEDVMDQGAPGLKPFSYLSQVDDPRRHASCARLWAAQIQERAAFLPQRSQPSSPLAWDGTRPLTVGYLSSGFHRHPTACLTAEYFECTDRQRFRQVAFSVGPDDGSELRRRIREAMARFHDLNGQTLARIADAIASEQVDILLDLRGYGGGAVTEVLATRPAPVQVNWLAYPGTMGADFMDYVVLDPFVATEEVLANVDEAPVLLPGSYQPSDSTRRFEDRVPTREACGLPAHGTVFVSFNNSYKFSPTVFGAWMAILKAVPGSVLWLLAGKAGSSTDANLRRETVQHGVDPARLVMSPKLPHLDYLARLSLADLFLDTLPYNAHTTASDALWAGCPVLTCAGRSFAARVAGSLLTSAGLSELVVENLEDYQQLAICLGNNPQQLAAMKARCAAARGSRLFDTARFCRDLEQGFIEMASRAAAGLPPAPIDLRRR